MRFVALSLLTSPASSMLTSAVSNSRASLATFRRAAFWFDAGEVTAVDIVNVLGRWESSDEWRVRTEFTTPGKTFDAAEQAGTRERFEM